jgi:hypothetical protein
MGLHRAPVRAEGAAGRVWAAVLGVVAFTAVTAGLAPAAVAAPTVATSATVAVSAATLAPGGTSRVTGTLRAGTKAVAGATVALQQRVAGSGTWRAWRTGTTDASGRFAATTGKLELSRDFRLHFAGTSRYLRADSTSKRVTVQQWVKVLTKPGSTPIVGSALTFTGTTSAGLVGDLVHLQLAEGTSWTTVATSQVNADGTYSVKGKATVAGTQQYRVQVDGKLGATGVATFPSLFTVSAWYYLQDLPVIEEHDLYDTSSVTVAGRTFYHPVRLLAYYGTAHATYNLSYKCSRFESTTGMSDSSSATVSTHQAVALDSSEIAAIDTAPGHSYHFAIDTAGSFRLTVSSAIVGTSAYVGWGDARILCAGKP